MCTLRDIYNLVMWYKRVRYCICVDYLVVCRGIDASSRIIHKHEYIINNCSYIIYTSTTISCVEK